MTESEINKIEASFNLTLPEFYKSTVLNYPFPPDSFADEFVLLNTPQSILEYNQDRGEYSDTGEPFVIGSDGGEEIYYLDLASDSSQVFTFDMETGKHHVKAKDWSDYLSQIEADLKEIEQDERAEQERKANKKWWEFWK
ncbi:MAG: SMI1/KNR4 family protein [Planctomycetota bacterium]|jgi:hypothetical protein